MEQKLHDIIEKVYREGLQKGQEEAARLAEEARDNADAVLGDAEEKAKQVIRHAHEQADQVLKEVRGELQLAVGQAVSGLEQQVANMVAGLAVSEGIDRSLADQSFVREMILAVLNAWNPEHSGVELAVLLPSESLTELDEMLKRAIPAMLASGLEIKAGDQVFTGFRIVNKEQGYIVDFTSEAFRELFMAHLRERTMQLLNVEEEDTDD